MGARIVDALQAPLDWPLLSGPLPWVVLAAGAAGLVVLLVRRDRRWWTRTVPLAVGAAVLVVLVVVVVVQVLWRPFPDPLPLIADVAIGTAALAVVLAFSHRGRVVAVVAVVAVLLASAQAVNAHYQQFPDLRSVLGLPSADVLPFADVPVRAPLYRAPAGQPVEQGWRPPADMPDAGVVSQVEIPPTASGFPARPGWVYLPPAYLGSTRAELPVLVLLSGQPGSPEDWIQSGELAQRMDDWAARHNGLAPVVVLPDHLSDEFTNPLCVDGPLGNAFTYLTVDVPQWVRSTLQVGTGRAVAGLSNGGTCSLQLAVNDPDGYPTFVDISGEDAPSLGSEAETIERGFGGDEAAYRAVNPLDVVPTGTWDGTAGRLVGGADDAQYLPQAQRVYTVLRDAGMDVELTVLPGGHTWEVWGPGLSGSLDWLGTRLGITT